MHFNHLDAGGNLIDTADFYTAFAPGLEGGESQTIIGRWLARRGRRDDVILMTNVGKLPGTKGLHPATIRRGLTASLRRLGTDHINVYYAHEDDPSVPFAETLGAFAELVTAGRVRALGAANHEPHRLREALDTAAAEGLPGYALLQCHYSLLERDELERGFAPVCADHDVAVLPFWGLERGFLTGKYRPGSTLPNTPRAEEAAEHLDERGLRVLRSLDDIAADRGVPMATATLAWLREHLAVVAPIASARSPHQLADVVPMASLTLHPAETERLSAAGTV